MIRRTNIQITLGISLLFFFIINIMSFGQERCVTDKCHADMGKGEFVHGPVGANICTVCHNLVEGKDHEFVFAAAKEELCLNCHEQSRDMLLKENVHTPVAEGNCIGCHDPHQSNWRYTLKGQAADLCYNCHDQKTYTKNFVHGPVAAGDCNACHNPHASAHDKQLIASNDNLCFLCHTEKSDIMNRRHIHAPVKEKCTNCHNPHSNDSEFLLSSATPDLCYDCHTNISELTNASYKHQPFQAGQCRECHDVHASNEPFLSQLTQEKLCFSCHEEMGSFITAQEYKHGPVSEGDCVACHNPHGSEYHRTLKKYFPDQFYMPYATDNYAICFECHNKDISLDEKTKTLTDFRDGERNLHYLHVNKEKKGRSCKSCHQVHASSQGKHIRKSVPFGNMNWDLPISYTKYDNGGKCVVGCHSPKEYSRK